MKKSIFAAVTSPGSRSKLEARNTIHAAGDSSKISKEKPCKSTSSVTSRPSTSEAALVTTILHNSATGLDDKLKLAQKVPDMDKYGRTDESASGNSSEEDSEFDEEVLRKLLKRKIEQAPAAKVIVSDAMMREALSEMSARKSSISTTAKSSAQSMLSKGGGGGDQRDKEEGKGDADISHQGSSSDIASASGLNISYADNVSPMTSKVEDSAENADSNGCPLEQILEFLQKVMTKDYKAALELALEVVKLEPNNELILEYMSVLKKVVHKEEENDYEIVSDSDESSTSSENAGEYTDELTTSSETDSVSGEEDTKSSTSNTASARESEEDEGLHHSSLEATDSENDKNEENVAENKEKETIGEDLVVGTDTESCSCKAGDGTECKDNVENANGTQEEGEAS